MRSLPDNQLLNKTFVIIPGSEKCGTSNLFHTLAAHSQINASRIKEPHYFALAREVVSQHLPLYWGLYGDGGGRVCLEASNAYLYSEQAPANVQEFINNRKILIMLRDPAKRVFSSYYHMFKKIPQAEKRPLASLISMLSGMDKAEVIRTEQEQIKSAQEKKKILRNYFGPSYLKKTWGVPFESYFDDPDWPYRYFQGSMYSDYVKRWEEYFGANVKILFLEEWIDKPAETVAGILDFIGLDWEDECLKLSSRKNPTHVPVNRLSRAYIKFRKDNKPMEMILKSLKALGLTSQIDRMRSTLHFKPKIDRETYVAIRGILQSEYEFWFSRYDYLPGYWKF